MRIRRRPNNKPHPQQMKAHIASSNLNNHFSFSGTQKSVLSSLKHACIHQLHRPARTNMFHRWAHTESHTMVLLHVTRSKTKLSSCTLQRPNWDAASLSHAHCATLSVRGAQRWCVGALRVPVCPSVTDAMMTPSPFCGAGHFGQDQLTRVKCFFLHLLREYKRGFSRTPNFSGVQRLFGGLQKQFRKKKRSEKKIEQTIFKFDFHYLNTFCFYSKKKFSCFSLLFVFCLLLFIVLGDFSCF